jgi:hypothetical protein
MLSLFAGTAHTALLTFDDLVSVPTSGPIQMPNYPPGYHGFLFSRLDSIGVGGGIFNYGAHSGYFALLNNHHGTGYITAVEGADFTFGGLWAKRWNTAPESGGEDSLFGTISGYRDGVMVWSVDTSLNGSYEYYASQVGLIDELRLGLGDNFLVDDLVLDSISPVPLPTAFWLFGSGFLGLFGFSRMNKVRSRQAAM